MESNSETMPPPPSIVQRETNIILDETITLVNPFSLEDSVSPRNIPKDITVGQKIPT
jgi:hypothetical protein